ncbi:MAG: cell division protein FtsQ [Bacilli bacterium]|nr:cell division protein FtsQ [Bacilli bacterium]
MENKIEMTKSQKLMTFVLSMSLYGLATLFTELIPSFQVGIVEFSVEYFIFIPLILAMLFDPFSAAVGAATGELIFSEIMLGQFGGLGELEKFITLTIGIYIAGRLVKNPKNIKSVAFASILAVIIQQSLGCIVDILKVQFAVEEFEAVAGLPESVFFTEGFACLNDILFSGVLFSLLPCMYLVPRLYGKIEPLLGVSPRNENTVIASGDINLKTVVYCAIAFVVAILGEFMSENGMSIIDWEATWAESQSAMIVSAIVAIVVIVLAVLKIKKRKEV